MRGRFHWTVDTVGFEVGFGRKRDGV